MNSRSQNVTKIEDHGNCIKCDESRKCVKMDKLENALKVSKMKKVKSVDVGDAVICEKLKKLVLCGDI